MAITISDVMRELDEAMKDLERVKGEIQALTAQESELTKVVNGWNAILAAKRSRNGDAPAAAPVPSKETALLSQETNDAGENKTQFVRDQIQAHVSTGVTVDDLKQAAASIGMQHAPSWPYGPLARLKASGEVVKRRGKFYPVQIKTEGGPQV